MMQHGGIADANALYRGDVVHRRLRPRAHGLKYRVFSLLLDLDRIEETAGRMRWFSYNRRNLVSFFDADHLAGEPAPLAQSARKLLAEHGLDLENGRILLLSYPRVLGYVFNPLSVFLAYDRAGDLKALIYEVNNTFGERTSYVVDAGISHDGVFAQSCSKSMFVSPFAPGYGRYGFRITDPLAPASSSASASLTLGVSFRDEHGPLIRTHFHAIAHPLTDTQILSALLAMPIMTGKVMLAIHWEALKLWWKGVPLIKGHVSQRYSVRHSSRLKQG